MVGRRQQPDDRAGDLRDPVDGRAERQREALGALQREPLGGELAEHQGDVGDRDGHQHQRDDVGRRPSGSPRSTSFGARSPARVAPPKDADRKPGQRDADLHGGEEAVGVRGEPGHRLAPAAAVGHRADLAVPQRDERDLGGGEHAADEDEDDDKPDVRERAVHGL